MAGGGAEPHCPDEGDIIWIDFNPVKGHEQRGHRRALVLTPRAYNHRVRLCILCPITSEVKGYPFEMPIPSGGTTGGVVLCDQVKNLSWAERNSEFIEVASPELVSHVRAKIKALLKIP